MCSGNDDVSTREVGLQSSAEAAAGSAGASGALSSAFGAGAAGAAFGAGAAGAAGAAFGADAAGAAFGADAAGAGLAAVLVVTTGSEVFGGVGSSPDPPGPELAFLGSTLAVTPPPSS